MRNPITWLITDTHWNTDFKQWRPADYGQLIVKNCRKVMAPQDVLIHLGDVINNRQGELSDYLDGIPAKTKILIRGNHDHQTDTWYMGKGFNFVCDQMIIGDILLSHIPQIIPQGIRINIHGHFHDNPIDKCWLHEPHLKEIYCDKHKLLAMEYVNYCPVQLREMWWDTLAVPSGETNKETKEN